MTERRRVLTQCPDCGRYECEGGCVVAPCPHLNVKVGAGGWEVCEDCGEEL